MHVHHDDVEWGEWKAARNTYHVGLSALRHVHDLDGDDLAADRPAPRPAHDGGGAVPDGLEQLVVRRADGELPLPPPPRQWAALLPLPHAAALLQGCLGGVTWSAPAWIKNHAQGSNRSIISLYLDRRMQQVGARCDEMSGGGTERGRRDLEF